MVAWRGVSTDRAMGYDTDTIIVQKGRIFSDAECRRYHLYQWKIKYGGCVRNSMAYETDPEQLYQFIYCRIIHFMTEMGARNSCSDDSVRPDNSTNVTNTIPLLPKDRLFYTFLVNTLNAENICEATNDTVTLSTPNCELYCDLIQYVHADSVCTYNTPSIGNDIDTSYGDCLHYRFLKSLGADSICKEIAVSLMCNLFGLMKKWLQEGSVSTNNATGYDTDTHVQKQMVFSEADCDDYKRLFSGYRNGSLGIYGTTCWSFSRHATIYFMSAMGAESSCYDDSVKSDTDTNVKNAMTLLSQDSLFYTFMVDTLDAGNICQARNDTVAFPVDKCDSYINLVRNWHIESRCTYNTPRIDNGRELTYHYCVYYRLAKGQGADSICKVSLIKNCDWYYDIVQSLVPTYICVFGLIGNLLSLCMFCSGAVDTSTVYQLQWLAGVDTTFILTWWVVEVLPEILLYYSGRYALTLYQSSIVSILTVCFRPLSYVARSCTVWLTVLIGLYRYLAVCQPFGKLFPHCERHGHKYVILVIILSFLFNIPHVFEYYLHEKKGSFSHKNKDGYWLYYIANYTGFSHTDLMSEEKLNDIHYSRIHPVVVVCIPCLILSFVTISILAELRKRAKKKKNMQTSQTSQTSITVMLVTILITFVICQLPYFVWYGFGGKIQNPDLDSSLRYLDEAKKTKGCGSFMFYLQQLVDAGLLLNSFANGFIYISS